jgi:hypothetical protein
MWQYANQSPVTVRLKKHSWALSHAGIMPEVNGNRCIITNSAIFSIKLPKLHPETHNTKKLPKKVHLWTEGGSNSCILSDSRVLRLDLLKGS